MHFNAERELLVRTFQTHFQLKFALNDNFVQFCAVLM